MLAFAAVSEAVLEHGDAVFQFQVLAKELLFELLGVDQSDQLLALFLEVFNHLRD
ncbi:hypothetical protein D3C71_2127320 [compost metagenome]